MATTSGMNRSDEVGVRLTRTFLRRIQSMNISWRSVSVVFVTFVVFLMRNGAAEASPAESNFTQGLMYLAKYGYFPPTVSNPKAGSLIEGGVFRDAVKKFQEFAQIPVTGELDTDTIDLMKLPRCGVTDNVGFGNAAKKRRRKRYTLQGSRWRVKTLTYQITKYPTKLAKSNVDAEVARAFKVWSDVTDLSFSPVSSGKVHIEIRFEMGEHGDGDPFDGPGGTLAHAYFPIYGGDAHFDDSETWTISKSSGTDLFQVAAHEFGHSLGLGHSDIRQALMAPFYRGYDANFKLHSDDVSAIQALYGKKSSDTENTVVTSPTKAPTPTKGPDAEGSASGPQLCQNSKIDTLLTTKDGTTYAFRGEYYWKLTDAGVASGFPKKITDDWPDLPTNLDAAFSWINGKIYFFKGSQYWRYTEKSLDSGYPKLIKKGFEGIPDNIDSAFVWSGNGKIYFFKADKYWRFNPDARPPVSESYPKEIKNWQGLPTTGNLDAALQYSNKMTYFFKDGQYWRFNDNDFEVDKADPPYPRPAGDWWFGCNGSKSGSLHVETIARRFNGMSPNPDSVLDADDSKKRRDTGAFEGANSSQKSNQPVSIQILFVISCISYLLTTVTAANFWNTD